MSKTKKCGKCKQNKLLAAFYNGSNLYGKDGYCIECRKATNNASYQKRKAETA